MSRSFPLISKDKVGGIGASADRAGRASPQAAARLDHSATIDLPVRYSDDAEWAFVGSLAVYPRDDGTYSIGRLSGVREWRDLDGETGFANMQAAIDHAQWLVSEQSR